MSGRGDIHMRLTVVRTLGDAVPVIPRIQKGGTAEAVADAATAARTDFAKLRDAQPITTMCGLCGWRYVGLAGDARTHAANHRTEAHPELTKRKRAKGMAAPYIIDRGNPTDDAERAEAEVEAEWRRQRARTDGDYGALGEVPAGTNPYGLADASPNGEAA